MRRELNAKRWDKKPWVNALFYLGGLALLFFFGFFVIGKIWGTAKTASDKTSAPPVENASSARPQSASPSAATAPAGAQQDKPLNLKSGPSIEALEPNPTQRATPDVTPPPKDNSEDVQDPRTEEKTDTQTQEPTTPDSDKPKRKRKTAPATDENTDSSVENTPRKRKKSEEPIDPNADVRNTDTETPPSNKTYRVQVGIYSTREAAEAAKQELDGKGITSHIRPATRNGKPYYSVTGGTYKVKANAEAQRDKMKEAGLDAYIKED